jgi:hypothetical protein
MACASAVATLASASPFFDVAMDFSSGTLALTTSSLVLILEQIPLSAQLLWLQPLSSTPTGVLAAVYPDWIARGSTGSMSILVAAPLPATTPIRAPTQRLFALSAPPLTSLQVTISASDLRHLTLQQFLGPSR